MFNRRLRIFKIPYLSPKDFQIRLVAVPSARIFILSLVLNKDKNF